MPGAGGGLAGPANAGPRLMLMVKSAPACMRDAGAAIWRQRGDGGHEQHIKPHTVQAISARWCSRLGHRPKFPAAIGLTGTPISWGKYPANLQFISARISGPS